MFLRLWNYLRGYVMINVTGFSVERFLNLAAHKGVYIWDVSYAKDGVNMKVSVPGFKMLKACARKTKCKIKITRKKGYPFLAFRYRKRKVFVGGILFFIFALYFLSSFIWLVEIQGNDRVATEEISQFFTAQGVGVGSFKYKINKKEIEKSFLNQFSDISWVNISIKGTKATIQMSETLPAQKIIDRSTPCHVVAAKNGLIMDIVTIAGRPLKKESDVVMEGDVIVSGEVIAVNDSGEVHSMVHAQAEVRAKTYYEINLKTPFTYEEKVYTGQTKKRLGLNIFGKFFYINPFQPSISYINYDKIISRNQMKISDDYPLPIILVTEIYKEFTPVQKERTFAQTMDVADKMVTSRIIHEFSFEADIIDKVLEFNQEEGGLAVKALITAIERIDKQVELEPAVQDGLVQSVAGEQEKP